MSCYETVNVLMTNEKFHFEHYFKLIYFCCSYFLFQAKDATYRSFIALSVFGLSNGVLSNISLHKIY